MSSTKAPHDGADVPEMTPEPSRLRKVLLALVVGFFLVSAVPVATVSAGVEGRITAQVRIVSVDLQREASRRVLRLQNGLTLTDEQDDIRRGLVRVSVDQVSSLIVVEYTAN